jgi:hypothetical protein
MRYLTIAGCASQSWHQQWAGGLPVGLFCMKLYDMTIRRRVKRRRGPNKPADERKDYLIQARVPRDLDEVLKQDAKRRRLSVSHLIRNVLQDTYELVDGVIGDVDQIVQDSVKLSGRVTRDAKQIARSAAGLRERATDRRDAEPGPDKPRPEQPHDAPAPESRREAPSSERALEMPAPRSRREASSERHRDAPAAEREYEAPAAETRREAPVAERRRGAEASREFDARTADVYAWQAVVLNRAAHCERCERPLVRGETAHLGLSQTPSTAPRWLCIDCLALLAER